MLNAVIFCTNIKLFIGILMKCFKFLLPIFVCLFFTTSNSFLFASITTDPIVLIEITDKYKEVRLGITETSIYLKFDKKILEYVNQEILDRNTVEANHFLDSEGFFVPNESAFLEDTKIEYLLTDIKSVYLSKGMIHFKYHNKKTFGFEDITHKNGNMVIRNFSINDLKAFIQYYNTLSS